jgi:hypothetical protein
MGETRTRSAEYGLQNEEAQTCTLYSVLCTLYSTYPLSPIPHPLTTLYLIPFHASIVSFSKAALSILMP